MEKPTNYGAPIGSVAMFCLYDPRHRGILLLAGDFRQRRASAPFSSLSPHEGTL
jgi:hypothetical protein